MKKGFILLLACLAFYPDSLMAYELKTNTETVREIKTILHDSAIQDKAIGNRIGFISERFLGTPYKAGMLVGNSTSPERLVIDFSAVDCLSFIEYVRALSLSVTEGEFRENLIRTRYVGNQVGYLTRKHFFSDWYVKEPLNAVNVTGRMGKRLFSVLKHLNRKGDGQEYVSGLGIIRRRIEYLPISEIDQGVLDHLKTGDFIGIYSNSDGLDVSHVGILIKKNGNTYFRNASSLSRNMRVVDTDFQDYIRNRPGILVLRLSSH